MEAEHKQNVVDAIERLPINLQEHYADKYRVSDLLSSNWLETDVVPEPEPTTIQLEEKHLWINSILKEPFKILTGEQGSGKSTFERLLLDLLREQHQHIIVINPETIRQGSQDVLVINKISEINEFFKKFPKAIERRQDEARAKNIDEDDYLDYLEKHKSGLGGRVAIFLMEANTYEAHGVDPLAWADFLKQISTNIRKWGFTATLTAHSPNQTSISSKLRGFSGLFDSAVHIECLAENDAQGEKIGSGKAVLKRNKNDCEDIVFVPYYKPKSKDY